MHHSSLLRRSLIFLQRRRLVPWRLCSETFKKYQKILLKNFLKKEGPSVNCVSLVFFRSFSKLLPKFTPRLKASFSCVIFPEPRPPNARKFYFKYFKYTENPKIKKNLKKIGARTLGRTYKIWKVCTYKINFTITKMFFPWELRLYRFWILTCAHF